MRLWPRLENLSPPFATMRAILTGSMRVGLRSHGVQRIHFFSRVLIDLAPQLVRLFAIHPLRLAARSSPDLAQSFKHQHAAGIVGTHVSDATRHPMGRVLIHPPDMSHSCWLLCSPFTGLPD